MFTGLVESVGTVVAVESMATGFRLRIGCPDAIAARLSRGGSIAVDGVCLTALDIGPDHFDAEVSPETIARTNMADLEVGTTVNLEHPLAAGDPLGGHFVQGHVDTVCEAGAITEEDDFLRMEFVVAPDERRFLVEKGSVAINGVSLTVAAMTDKGFDVQLVPHTLERTNLIAETRAPRFNLEFDVLGKYVAQLVAAHLQSGSLAES